MNTVDVQAAHEYAKWFRCLANGTRLVILNVVATAGRPLTVGEIVENVDKSQSTVSKHLEILSSEGFVISDVDGTRTLVRVNPKCMTALPEAAAAIMGSAPPGSRR